MDVILKCQKYVQESEERSALREHEIDRATESYIDERRKYLYELLDDM